MLKPLKKIRENKSLGYIFLNGNVRYEHDLVHMCKHYILEPDTFKESLNESKKVLLVTAAWGKNEHNEQHVIDAFRSIGIPEKKVNGYPTNIQNLSVRSMFYYFKNKEKHLYRIYNYKQSMIRSIKHTYYIQNYYTLKDIEDYLEYLMKNYAQLTLFDFFHLPEYPFQHHSGIYLRNCLKLKKDDSKKIEILEKISKDKKALELCKKIRQLICFLKQKDNTMYKVLEILENDFLESSGIQNCELYLQQKKDLKQRIMSSASIFIFGGNVYKLNNTLRFYGLSPVFKNALRQGSNIYGVSAGSICTTGRFAFCEDIDFKGGYLNSQDVGMALLDNLWIFPHANDYEYINNNDRNLLSLFSLRYSGVSVGLSEKSILMCGYVHNSKKNKNYEVYRSIGYDPVHVFGPQGIRIDLNNEDQVLIENCEFFPGRTVVATKDELKKMKKKADR